MPRQEGDWAWTANGKQVFVPDVRIPMSTTNPDYHGVPFRGRGATIGVWDRKTDRFVGFAVVDELGFKDVKAWMEVANLGPVQHFMK